MIYINKINLLGSSILNDQLKFMKLMKVYIVIK